MDNSIPTTTNYTKKHNDPRLLIECKIWGIENTASDDVGLVNSFLTANNIAIPVANDNGDNGENKYVLGIDEAGYGSAVGDFCVAGVILPETVDLPNVRDSKKMSASQREKAFDEIQRQAIAIKVVFAKQDAIETSNVLAVNMDCMADIIATISPTPRLVIVDGSRKPKIISLRQPRPPIVATLVGGDNKSLSVAAASIVAKVSRDNYIKQLVKDHPELERYGVDSNMGYLSIKHRDALDQYGRTRHHRSTYKYKWQKQQ